MKIVGLIGRGICQRYECIAKSATAPHVRRGGPWQHEIDEWRAEAGHTTLVIVVDCAHDSIIEFHPGALWSRIRRLDHTQVECAAIAAGWAAIVGLDGKWMWRVARVVLVALLAFVVARARDGPSRWRASKHIAFAAISLPAAATIAVGYASKGGSTTRAAAGLIAAAGSIGLLVTGLVSLASASPGWRRWTILPSGLVTAFVLVSAIFPAVYATNVPRPRLGAQRPSDFGLKYLDATFETVDGFALSGWYIPSANRAAVVLLHGASSTRTSVLGQAEVLAHHGYGVLMFDARGHGRSEGRAMEFGWYGDRDIGAAIDYLQGRPDVDATRIGAVGMSMGGEEAIGAMAGDPRIRATVAEGATNRVYADKTWLVDQYGIRGSVQLAIEWLTYRLADLLTAATPPASLGDAARLAAPRPILLIAAGNVEDEQLAGESIRANAPGSVRMWIAVGADHTAGLGTQPTEWTRQVTEFLDASLT